MKFIIAIYTCLLLSASLLDSAFAQHTVTGSDGEKVTIQDTSRIITIGSSITETVFALGAGNQVIAVDQSSSYPPQVHQLPKVPYVRTLNAEGILSLSPNLIISTADARPASVIDQIRSAGTPVLLIPDEPTPENAIHKIGLIAQALQKEEQGELLISALEQKLDEAEQKRKQIDRKPGVMFILSTDGQKSLMVAGKNSSAETVINLAGGKPVFDSFNGYKTVSPEAIASANPQVILMMSSREHVAGGKKGLKKIPGVQLTDAARDNRLLSMDGNYLIGFGPRLGDAVLELMEKLHPELKISDSQ